MNWTWFFKILLPLFGRVLSEFLLPLASPKIKTTLDKILPIAEHWVEAVETTGLPGTEKYYQAFKNIKDKCTEQKITEVSEGLIDTAIQLAWVKLGLNEK